MQNITLARIKSPPMLVGLCVASLLLFAVVGVVKEVSSMNAVAPIQNSVAAGLRSVEQPQPLPTFALSQQPTGEGFYYSVTANEAPPMTVAMPEWLAVKRGEQVGDRKVFAGWWFSCTEITMDGRWVGHGAGTWDWSQLNADQRMAVVERCAQEDATYPLPTPTPVVYHWLDTTTDSTGARWVWIGEWFVSCNHITPDYVYHNDRDVEAVAAWNHLPFDDQDQVRRRCRE